MLVYKVLGGLDVCRVTVAVNENVLRVDDLAVKCAVNNVHLPKAASIKQNLLLIHNVFEFEFVLVCGPRPIFVEENLLLLVVVQFLVFNLGIVINAGKDCLDGLFHQRNVDTLALGQSVDDYGVAVKLVILGPLWMSAALKIEIALLIAVEFV